MNVVKATLYFLVLEFITAFAWFAVVVHIKDIINFMVSEVSIAQVTTVGQNVVKGLNVVFLAMFFGWIVWYFYMLHTLTNETTYALSQDQIRRF